MDDPPFSGYRTAADLDPEAAPHDESDLAGLAAREAMHDPPRHRCAFPLVRKPDGFTLDDLVAASGPCLTCGAPPTKSEP